jgi:L-lactate dehydrogenase complex protein LldF
VTPASQTFPLRVHRALEDAQLGASLGHVSAQLKARRLTAFASLANADDIRTLARAAKFDTLRDLPAQLERFEAKLIANGVHVEWADSAATAQRVVLDIARRHRVKRVAKAKSMISEEIHLNDALQKEGLEVIETDLGEYIVQLNDDRPSHIVAPIIHMTRADVGRVMHERLDTPLTDDPATLGRYAREKLREVFLTADMGITGANFGVVETGTICLVTNEGNGRMVTALPRVHVVLMGIEKLVPTLADLDRMLKLLPRSATGQKLTAYTSLINGPRREGDDCGPDEMHVVLIDNGRSRLYAGDCAEILGCMRCGACMNVCPVYTSVGGHAYGDTYPGPIGAVVTPGLRGLDPWAELAGASSLCGACRDVCPVRLDIPRMLLALRRDAAPRQSPLWLRAAMRGFGASVGRPRLHRMAGAVVRAVLRRIRPQGLRAPASQTFQQQLERRDVIRGGRDA